MKNKRKKAARTTAILLAAMLTINSLDLSAFITYAAEITVQTESGEQEEAKAAVLEREEQKEETENTENTVFTITGFADLEESIVNQQLAIGALEEEIVFPDTLEVTVSFANASAKESAENGESEEIVESAEIEETTDSETEETGEETTESEEEETGTEGEATETEGGLTGTEGEAAGTEGETAGTEEEATGTEGEAAETKGETTEIEGAAKPTGGEAAETGEGAPEEAGKEVNTAAASLMDIIVSAFAPMTVYAAESEENTAEPSPAEPTEITESKENLETVETKEITLTGITWEVNPAESDGEAFDSSEACGGYCYVYTPVLPKTDAEGNALVLGENVELPMLYVLIGEHPVSVIDESETECGDFSIRGGVIETDYRMEGSELQILTETKLTIRNTNPSGATSHNIHVTSEAGANITLAGVNIDVSHTEDAAFSIDTPGTVTITLASGTINKLKSGGECAGIEASIGTTLILNGTGSLEAIGGMFGAGIGGGIDGAGGTITINGGNITAGRKEGSGAGIGGGSGGAGGTITINGGNITAKGSGGAGIGGGSDGAGGIITIAGGNVIADAIMGAGIGGGRGGAGGEVTISGGNIMAGGNTDIGNGRENSDPGTIKDASGNPLFRYIISLCGLNTETAVSSLSGVTYSVKDMKTMDQDMLYLYLPEGAELESVSLGNAVYRGILEETSIFHRCTYKSLSDTKLQAACMNCENGDMTIEIKNPASNVYTGEPIEAVVTTEGTAWFRIPKVTYTGSTLTEGKPLNPGTYQASIILDGVSISTAYRIEKVTPQITGVTTPTSYTVGDHLRDLSLTGMVEGVGNQSLDDGFFIWKAPNTKLTIADHGKSYAWMYIPADTKNYNTVEGTVTISVEKPQYPPHCPAGIMNVSESCDEVSKITLPKGWEWNQEDASTSLEIGEEITVTAEYTGEDKENYKETTMEIKVVRSNCEHNEGEERVDTKPACTTLGSGYTECDVCGEKVQDEIIIPSTGHSYVMDSGTENVPDGYLRYRCEKCEHSYLEAKPVSQESNQGSGNGTGGTIGSGSGNTAGSSKEDQSVEHQGSDRDEKESSLPVIPQLMPETEPQQDLNAGRTFVRKSSLQKDGEDQSEVPFIKGENGKEGWDVIREAAEQSSEGTAMTVEMNGTTMVPGKVLDAIKGKDVSIVLDIGNGITWTVNGKDIGADTVGDIDLGVTMGAQAGKAIPTDIIKEVSGERPFVNLTLSYNGEFGFTATLTIKLEKGNAGLYANLFYYNPRTNALEFMSAGLIDENGNAALEFTHASDYTIILDTKVMSEENTVDRNNTVSSETADSTENAEETAKADNKAWSLLGIFVIAALALIAGMAVVERKKKTIK